MRFICLFVSMVLCCFCVACSENVDIDTEKPVIDLTSQDAFPLNGDTLYFGETFTLKAHFSDNQELGSYSVDIHNNFDHHSHSTEVDDFELDSVKTPVNPFTMIQDYNIPAKSQMYEAELEIALPQDNTSGTYDAGDYHFMISLTDHEGWSVNKGMSIKILHR